MESLKPDTRVVIVDDFTLNREGLAVQLRPHYRHIRCAWNLPSLVKGAGGGDADLILLNMGTAGSQTLLQMSLDLLPAVIVYGLSEERGSEVVAAAEAGAAGLHLRSESFDHLLRLMRHVGNGHARCSAEVSAILLGKVYSEAAGYRDNGTGLLTAREAEILVLLEEGLSNKQIATRLCVTIHTVKNHVHSLLGKLGVQSRTEATRFARAIRYSDGSEHQSLKRSLASVH